MLSITMVAHIKLFFKFHIKFPHQTLRSEISYQLESAFYWDGIGFILEEQLIGDVCIKAKKLYIKAKSWAYKLKTNTH